jgi:hypothetical protein
MSCKNHDIPKINISKPAKTGRFIPGLGKIIRAMTKDSDSKKKSGNTKSIRSLLKQSKFPPLKLRH